MDTATETYTDPALDTSTCTSLTASVGGVCNIVEQCGCTTSQYCEYEVDTSCVAREVCVDGSRGTLGISATCDPSDDRCAPGHICVMDAGGSGYICWRWCEVDGDCPTGYACSVGLTTSSCSPTPFAHSVCYPS